MKPSASTRRAGCASKCPPPSPTSWAPIIVIAAPVQFHHRADEWWARVAARRAVRYDISYDPEPGALVSGRVLENQPRAGARARRSARPGRCWAWTSMPIMWPPVCSTASGNPIGEPVTIAVDTAGLRASRRDGRVRAAITGLLDHAHQHNCSAIVVENLDFADARATGRETLGRGQRGKRLRRTVAGIPTAKVPHPADRHGRPPRDRDHRGGPGLHQPLGCPALAQTPTTTDFRPGHRHRASRGGGRDRQTWPRLGDQASAGRTPHPTADACGHSTGQT